ncbi:MAG: XRE family transcriptional regulator [Desulfobacteraceae bacterium]|nr:MAG: XRE family transcriptional regulator [Desulfobacteraceae bacterium]
MNQFNTHYSPAKIQYLLKEAGYTQKQIAEEEGVSEMTVSNVINFNRVSKRLMIAVASRIKPIQKKCSGSNTIRPASRVGQENEIVHSIVL